MEMRLVANAKLNLFLHVTGLRGGYHTIESLMVFLDICDDIVMMPSDDLVIEFDTSEIHDCYIDRHDNTIVQAATLLAQCYGINPTGHIFVKKRIPVGAGLGGGAADAAAVLQKLPELWGMPSIELENVAMQCGVDTLVCLHSTAALVGGIGEKITKVDFDMSGKFIVLAMAPDTSSLSAKVYAKFDEISCSLDESVLDLINANGCAWKVVEKCHNALYVPSVLISPRISNTLDSVNCLNGCLWARMTGSGGACFGVFDNYDLASKAADTLRGLGYWSSSCRLVNKAEEKTLV